MEAIAITDDVTTCDCCGRTDLKRTVVLRSEDGAIRYHGTSCAAIALYGYSDASVNNRVRKAAINAQHVEAARRADATRKTASAAAALQLWAAGEDRRNPIIEAQHRIWRQSNDVFEPGPSFVPWLQWLQQRAAA